MRITVVGAGYVGLTTGVCLAALGHRVQCVDIVPEKLALIGAGHVPFYEPGLEESLRAALARGTFSLTADLEAAVASSEVTLICVGTPSRPEGIDLTYVISAAGRIGRALSRDAYHVVVVKSTVVPGTTAGVVRRTLESASGLQAGEFGLCMNPEFLREGSAVDDFTAPDRIVIGQWDDRSGQRLAEAYRGLPGPRVFTTPANAEMIKYASNSLLATLISFSNEIASVCEVTPGTDVEGVLAGLEMDRRLSPVVRGDIVRPPILDFLKAGSGFGGSCLPKDVNALRSYARQQGCEPHLLDAVMKINADRAAYLEALAELALGPLDRTTVAVLGLAFKAGTDDLRDSPAIAIMTRLLDRGAHVRVYDPLLTAGGRVPRIDSRATLAPTPLDALRGADAAVIGTAWPEFRSWDWASLCDEMRQPIIIDGRNAFHDAAWPPHARYLAIGRVPEPAAAPERQPSADLPVRRASRSRFDGPA
jgi:UDPglucose 6-dehydrogenase/GDP-mannose 6-dehydrogenase